MFLMPISLIQASYMYTLKTGTPIGNEDPILMLLRGVSRPEIKSGVGIHSTPRG